ncbi:hypothetical protein [Pseudogemmobacter bohemicus]|uniref:hypothetical protein n=1 Tax=Pseudogemmobacter bohemicus TaxID=2250708 RepID=UPI000DD42D7E|nr:hypothetical protein [Pseudogemmobacter bohemicus]
MTTLRQHIQNQQDMSCTLCGVIEAIAILDNEGRGQGTAVTALIQVAGELAEKLNHNLDSINLPEAAA